MVTMGKLPQTPGPRRSSNTATDESRNLGHNYIGTEHILLGLLREQEGVAAQVLMNLGLETRRRSRRGVESAWLPNRRPFGSDRSSRASADTLAPRVVSKPVCRMAAKQSASDRRPPRLGCRRQPGTRGVAGDRGLRPFRAGRPTSDGTLQAVAPRSDRRDCRRFPTEAAWPPGKRRTTSAPC